MYRPTPTPSGVLMQSPQSVYTRPQQQIRSQSPNLPYYSQPQPQTQRQILQPQSQPLKQTIQPPNPVFNQPQLITQRLSSPQTIFTNPLQQSMDISSQIISSINQPVTPPTQKPIQVQLSTIQPTQQILIPATQSLRQDKPIQVVDIKQYEQLWQRRLEEAIKEREAQFGSLKDKRETERYERQAKDREIDNLQLKIREHEGKSDQNENTIQYYKRLTEELQNSLNETREALEQKNSIIGQLEFDLEAKNGKIADQSKDLQRQYTVTSELQREITQASQRYSNALDDLDRANQEIRALNNDIKGKKDQLAQKDQAIVTLQGEINGLLQKIRDLEEENRIELEKLAEEEQLLNQKSQIYESEMKTWKQKFVDLNRDYHNVQETLNLKEVELEHLQKAVQAKTQAANDLRSSTARRSTKGITDRSPIRSSDYVQSALNENDLAKIQQLSGVQQK